MNLDIQVHEANRSPYHLHGKRPSSKYIVVKLSKIVYIEKNPKGSQDKNKYKLQRNPH